MKKLYLIPLFLLLPCLCFSQTDSLRRKVIGWQFSIPFEVGLGYYLPKNHPATSEFGHLLNTRKTVGTRIQIGSFQLQLHDRFFIELAFNFDNIGFKEGSALKELQEHNPDYFIQGRSKYGQSEGAAEGSYVNNRRYLRLGAGYNILLKPLDYLKPYAAADLGNALLPASKYGFKEYSSNHFFTKEYSYGKLKCYGFNTGICFSHYLLSDDRKTFALWGLKLEYSNITVKGTGKITQSDLYLPATESFVPVKENFQYISLGVFMGFSSGKDKPLTGK